MQLDQNQIPRGTETAFRVPEHIPLFPLPNVVFFPRTYLPLHVFEPRYREMVADATLAGQCMGMVLLKDGWEQDYFGNPPIFETGCVGRLISVHPLPGGRSNILLQGLHRFDIQEQFYDKSYREARIVLKPAHATDTLDPRVRVELIRLVREYMGTHDDGGVWHELSRPDVTDEVLVNNLSASLDVTPLEKQFLLEAESLPERARRLNELIQFKLCEQHGARGSG